LLLSTTVNCGRKIHYPAGIEFDYVDQSGDLRITGLLTMRGNQKNADWALDERTTTYAEFDKWDDQTRQRELSGVSFCDGQDDFSQLSRFC